MSKRPYAGVVVLTHERDLRRDQCHAHLIHENSHKGTLPESRRSNPNAGERNSLAAKRLTNSASPVSGNSQETGDSKWLD